MFYAGPLYKRHQPFPLNTIRQLNVFSNRIFILTRRKYANHPRNIRSSSFRICSKDTPLFWRVISLNLSFKFCSHLSLRRNVSSDRNYTLYTLLPCISLSRSCPDWLSRAFSPQWSEWCFRLPVRQIFLLPTNIRTSSAKRTKFSQHLINSLPNSSSMIFNSKWLKGLPCSFPFINCV